MAASACAHAVRVIMRDSLLLCPAGKKSLADLGELVGLPKVELEEDQISHMDRLLRENRDLFLEYAQRDPEICVEHALIMMSLNHEVTGEYAVPPTLSSIGVVQLIQTWEASGLDRHAVLGTENVNDPKYSKRLGRSIKLRRDVPLQARQLYESFATECYHGGRNEQFFFGAGKEGVWNDYDLCGAYTTAMLTIGLPDWTRLHPTRDQDAFQPEVMGYARVRFEFPPGTRFPCLPVRSPYGLVFPLSGESCCCSPEIYLAAKMGARLQILDGIILPSSFHVRPFEAFVIGCNKRRKSYEKGSLPEQLWKEIGNSLYGKLAQGLMMKRCFDSRSGDYRPLPPSRVTNPFFAAYITSFVRAVLGEILSRLLDDVEVCSATTDGFLTTASADDIQAATQGPLCRLFAQARLRVCGDQTILEAKHRIAQPLGWRTRGQATLKPLPGEPVVLAKAGIKPPRQMEQKTEQNDWMVSLFQNRTAKSKLDVQLLRCLPEIHKHGGDLVGKTITRRVSMEYDWKRRPIHPCLRHINGTPHLYFDTFPWACLGDFLRCREKWEAFRKRGGGVLKAVDDLSEFNDWLQLEAGPLRVPRRSAAITIAKRMFLRAYVRSAWGLDAGVMSYSELAGWLTGNGYRTSKADVENARRPNAKPVEHVVVANGTVDRFLTLVQSRFPSFEAHRLIPP